MPSVRTALLTVFALSVEASPTLSSILPAITEVVPPLRPGRCGVFRVAEENECLGYEEKCGPYRTEWARHFFEGRCAHDPLLSELCPKFEHGVNEVAEADGTLRYHDLLVNAYNHQGTWNRTKSILVAQGHEVDETLLADQDFLRRCDQDSFIDYCCPHYYDNVTALLEENDPRRRRELLLEARNHSQTWGDTKSILENNDVRIPLILNDTTELAASGRTARFPLMNEANGTKANRSTSAQNH